MRSVYIQYRVLVCRLNVKHQTACDEYDITRLNVHELQKFNKYLAKCLRESLTLNLFYSRKLQKTHVWPNKNKPKIFHWMISLTKRETKPEERR